MAGADGVLLTKGIAEAGLSLWRDGLDVLGRARDGDTYRLEGGSQVLRDGAGGDGKRERKADSDD